jgi:hypothetical protein
VRCIRCPVPPGLPCPGESGPRLCDLIDPAHPDYRPEYAGSIVATAEQLHREDRRPAAAGLPVAVAMQRTQAANRCEWRSTEGCGCAGARCALRGGAIVSHLDCFDCVGRYG